jgi:dienelactone hydrolase
VTGSSLDLDSFWSHVAATIRPSHAFRAETREEWNAWRAALLSKLAELLGPDRPRVPLAMRVIERRRFWGYTRETVVYDTEPGVSTSAFVLRPIDRPHTASAPGLLCLHGHGTHGKSYVAGESGMNVRRRRHIWRSRYNVAEHFARNGYVCLCPDARGWGDRSDGFYRTSSADPRPPFGGTRDPCNVHFLKAQLLGLNLLWLNLWDDLRGLDCLAELPNVDANRLGAVGLSWGGTRALWTAALDSRIRTAVVSCSLTRVATQTLKLANTCGSQLLPGMLAVCDFGDVGALVAPRPILCESGARDATFPLADAKSEFAVIQRAYDLLGVGQRCEHHVFDGGHRFDGTRTFSFVDQWLRAAPASDS